MNPYGGTEIQVEYLHKYVSKELLDKVQITTSVPEKTPFKQGYQFYSKNILPLIGKLFSKDNSAYQYLSDSASVFPYGEALNNILRKIGFIEVRAMPQTFGVATIYSASKKQ